MSRHTIERMAAFATKVVASVAIRLPFNNPRSANRASTQSNTSRCVSRSISRRVREMGEWTGVFSCSLHNYSVLGSSQSGLTDVGNWQAIQEVAL